MSLVQLPRPLVCVAQAPGGLIWTTVVYPSPSEPGVYLAMIAHESATSPIDGVNPVVTVSHEGDPAQVLKSGVSHMLKLMHRQSDGAVLDEQPAGKRGDA